MCSCIWKLKNAKVGGAVLKVSQLDDAVPFSVMYSGEMIQWCPIFDFLQPNSDIALVTRAKGTFLAGPQLHFFLTESALGIDAMSQYTSVLNKESYKNNWLNPNQKSLIRSAKMKSDHISYSMSIFASSKWSFMYSFYQKISTLLVSLETKLHCIYSEKHYDNFQYKSAHSQISAALRSDFHQLNVY